MSTILLVTIEFKIRQEYNNYISDRANIACTMHSVHALNLLKQTCSFIIIYMIYFDHLSKREGKLSTRSGTIFANPKVWNL